MIRHHPEDASLTSYAAGSLPAAMALVVSCHLEYCKRCRRIVSEAEEIGGALIEQLGSEPPQARARAEMLARLDQEPALRPSTPSAKRPPSPGTRQFPANLQRMLGNAPLSQKTWRSLGPGIRLLKLDCGEGKAILLDIAPDHAVPVHSHHGTEMTLILNGDYVDGLGHFTRGDVADLDNRTEHQPKAGPAGCLCLAGMDAPLRYKSLLPRLLQPLFGI